MTLTQKADFELRNEGTIAPLWPLTGRAAEWIAENIGADALTFANAIVIEHRYVADIVEGAQADGMMFEERR